MATIALTTYRDLMDHTLDYLGSSASKDANRDARRAIQAAYRELTYSHRWSYFYQRGRLNTVASYTTGTITYTHTGGSSERLVTLAGGTWPSWADLGQIAVNNIVYQVAERKSDTLITLSINSNPGANVAAGTSYTLYRDSYVLPVDFLACDEMINTNNYLRLRFVPPGTWLSRQRILHSPATPHIYSIAGGADYYGAMSVSFFPPPDQIYAIDFLYQRRPRPLLIDEYKTGTASVNATSTTVTGTGTTWTSSMVGSAIRLSGNTTDFPTNNIGANLYVAERIITAFTSATSITVDAAINTGYTGVKYLISDPVDIEEGAMMNALLRCIEKQTTISRIMRNEQIAEETYRKTLLWARETDSRSFARTGSGGDSDVYRLIHFPKGPDVS